MKIAFWVDADENGGAEKYLVRLASALQSEGHEITIVGKLPGWHGETSGHELGGKLTGRRSILSQAGNLVRSVPVMRRYFRRAEFDVVHVQYVKEKLLSGLVLPTRTRLLWTEHGPLPPKLPRAAICVLRIWSRRARILAVGEPVAASLQSQGISSTVVQNPLPSVRAIRPAPEGPIAYLGRLHHLKRVNLLLEAAARLPEREFVILGTGPHEQELRTLAPSNVQFFGYVDEPSLFLSACSAVVLTSGRDAREGSPLALLEARAMGVPVLMAEDSHAAPEGSALGAILFTPEAVALEQCIRQASNMTPHPISADIAHDRSAEVWLLEHKRVFAISHGSAKKK